jgi:hypothetical protein
MEKNAGPSLRGRKNRRGASRLPRTWEDRTRQDGCGWEASTPGRIAKNVRKQERKKTTSGICHVLFADTGRIILKNCERVARIFLHASFLSPFSGVFCALQKRLTHKAHRADESKSCAGHSRGRNPQPPRPCQIRTLRTVSTHTSTHEASQCEYMTAPPPTRARHHPAGTLPIVSGFRPSRFSVRLLPVLADHKGAILALCL